MKGRSNTDTHASAAVQAAGSTIVAAYAELGGARPAQQKVPVYAKGVKTLLESAIHNLSPEDEAAARHGARAQGWPDGLFDEYQRYITLLQQTKAVLDRIMPLRGTSLLASANLKRNAKQAVRRG